ncbi:MAG: isopentenyl phosphate kinase [Candidatus Poseidoniaceae archaeon]|jgi:isopentenyl phosphate kinase|nr:isopentenyl phosphate kinase [Candidatus Poseidoniaceae archaeon]
MVRRIVVKFGGALITKKDEQCVAHVEIIRNLCSVVHSISQDGVQVIIVHGAGSFGHLKAKRWRLNEGQIPGFSVMDDSCTSQLEAVEEVRCDMLELNSIIVSELENLGLIVHSHPPHEWARNLGPNFSGTLERFSSTDPGIVHVTFGDVVDVDNERRFGILSGDDIVARLSLELPDIESLIFAMGGVDGLLKVPPNIATDDDLIEEWSPDVEYEGLHRSDIDVTGGIGLKIKRGHLVAQSGIGVYLVNGEYPMRIESLVRNELWRGTTILP